MNDALTEYKVADRKPWFADSKIHGGLPHKHSLAIGVISAIIDDCYRTPEEKVLEILGTLSDRNQVWSDRFIPDGYVDTKKASRQWRPQKKYIVLSVP